MFVLCETKTKPHQQKSLCVFDKQKKENDAIFALFKAQIFCLDARVSSRSQRRIHLQTAVVKIEVGRTDRPHPDQSASSRLKGELVDLQNLLRVGRKERVHLPGGTDCICGVCVCLCTYTCVRSRRGAPAGHNSIMSGLKTKLWSTAWEQTGLVMVKVEYILMTYNVLRTTRSV